MIKILGEAPEFNDNEIRKANRLLKGIATVVENAFSGFDTSWSSKPTTDDFYDMDGELYVQKFELNVNIAGILFKFTVSISNYFAKKFTDPLISFGFAGYEQRTKEITPLVANEILKASKVADRLKKEISQVLEKYSV